MLRAKFRDLCRIKMSIQHGSRDARIRHSIGRAQQENVPSKPWMRRLYRGL
ncbi:hypothetical protein SCH4B_4499 [Ruegeria sp. TrichCH4B]|nr:hypothetical protein SCH4B_4499 [Ruegeria sp. TrichCH4B]